MIKMEHKLLRLLESDNDSDNKLAFELLKKAPQKTKRFFNKFFRNISEGTSSDDNIISQKSGYNIIRIYTSYCNYRDNTRCSNETIIKWLKDVREKSV